MAKLTATILDEPANEFGEWNVKIRIGHLSKSEYLATDEFVSKRNLTSDGGIKSTFIVEHLSDLLSASRQRQKRHVVANHRLIRTSIAQINNYQYEW